MNSLDLSRSGRDLTVTLGRSIGADLAETVQLPADENRFADSLGVLVTGQTLTVTIGRTAPLPDLVDTATLPSGGMGGGTDTNDFVTGGAFTLSGQQLSLQLTGTPGFTTVDFPAITLPTGGGGGDNAFDWATVGDTSLVPTEKLGPGVANADRILRGNQTWGRINANTLTANFLNTGSPDEADFMLFADSGPGRQLSFITYSGFLDGIAGAGLIHGGETLHLDATGATTGQVFSYTGDGTTLNFEWIDLPTGGGGGTSVSANPTGLQTPQLKTVTIGSTDYQVRSTFAVKYLSDRPVATAAELGHLYHVLQEGEAYIAVDDAHISSTPSGTFNTIPNRSDLHVVATLPTNLNNLTTGHFYYHAGGSPQHGGYEFYEVVISGTKQLKNVHASRALAGSRSNTSYNIIWLGAEADSTDALAYTYALASNTNYFYYNESAAVLQRLNNTSFSGPNALHHYRWLGIGGASGSGTTDGVADSVDLSVSGGALTMTLGRTVGADLTDTVTLPTVTDTDNYVDGVVMALGSGSSLSVTLERTGGLGDLTAVIDLPAAGLSEVEHDETLLGDRKHATDLLGVSVHDVIEQFAESVKYFTTSTSLNTGNFRSQGAALHDRQSRIPPYGSRDGIQPRQCRVFRPHSPA